MPATDDIPLPLGWTKTVRTSVLHAISVAFGALTRAWGAAATSRRRTVRLQAELDRARTEIALLTEELAIKNDRSERMPPRRRPHYRATDRLRILQLEAARGWSTAQAAEIFAVTQDTIVSWLERTDEENDRGPMKGATLLATLQQLGVMPSFSRPHVSDDNPFSEALFRTAKYRPEYLDGPLVSLDAAREWVRCQFDPSLFRIHRHARRGPTLPVQAESPRLQSRERGTGPRRSVSLGSRSRVSIEIAADSTRPEKKP